MRLWVVASLLLVIMFKRVGIFSMWLSISTLVVIQFAQLSGALSVTDYTAPLKGLVIPVVITWLYLKLGSKQK